MRPWGLPALGSGDGVWGLGEVPGPSHHLVPGHTPQVRVWGAELSIGRSVGGSGMGVTARNPDGIPPPAKYRGKVVEGEASLLVELWDGGLPALPLGRASDGHKLQSPPCAMPGVAFENSLALFHILGT